MIILLCYYHDVHRGGAPDKSIDLCADVCGSRHGKSPSFVVRIARKKSVSSRSGVPSAVSRPFVASHVCGDVECAIFDRAYPRKAARIRVRIDRRHRTLDAAPGAVISA